MPSHELPISIHLRELPDYGDTNLPPFGQRIITDTNDIQHLISFFKDPRKSQDLQRLGGWMSVLLITAHYPNGTQETYHFSDKLRYWRQNDANNAQDHAPVKSLLKTLRHILTIHNSTPKLRRTVP